jgi:hypothetical protein
METPDNSQIRLTSLSSGELDAYISQHLLQGSRSRYQIVRDLVAEGMKRNDADLLVRNIAHRIFVDHQPDLQTKSDAASLAALPLYTYRSPHVLSIILTLCFIGIMGLDIWGIANNRRLGELITDVEQDPFQNFEARAQAIDNEAFGITMGYLGAVLVTSICFVWWLYRCRRNLEIWAVDIQFTPKWTWLGFLIPFLNIWRPHQVVQEVWKASNPDYPTHRSNEWRSSLGSGLVTLWWVMYVLNELIGRTISYPGENASLEEYSTFNWIETVSYGVDMASAFLALLVVYKITQRQRAKYQSLHP